MTTDSTSPGAPAPAEPGSPRPTGATPPAAAAAGSGASASGAPDAPSPPARLAAQVLHVVERYALAVLLVLVLVFFSVWTTTGAVYLQADNFRNIVSSQAVLTILALGSVVPLVCGQFDLSSGSVAGLTSVMTAAAFAHWHLPLVLGVLLGIGIGAAVGVANGLLVTHYGVNALITTLGTASVVTGIVNWYTNGTSIIEGIPTALSHFGSATWLGLPQTSYLLVVVSLLVWYLLEHTPYGRYIHAIGINPGAAQLVGIRIPSMVRRSFVVSGAASGLAGVVLLAQTGAGNPGVGGGLTLTALTAAFLGATSVRPGRFNVLGTLLAIFFLAAAITGLTFAGVRDYINDLFTGVALVLAVAVSTVLRRRRTLS